MRCTRKPPNTPSKISHTRLASALNYESLAGIIAARMTGLLQASDARRLFPPFQVVIMSQHGTVVFEFEVNRDGKVRRADTEHRVLRSHFPATVFFTDRSQITRTFSLERSKSGGV